MIYRLPDIQSNHAGFNALAGLATATGELAYDRLELSFTGVSWFDANMAAPLGGVLARILDRYNTVSIVDLAWGQRSILERNGFLGDFGYPTPAAWAGTVLPFTRFKQTDANRFYDYLDEHLPGKGMPNMTSGFSLRFQQSLGEIFINAQTHSDSTLGVFVCGQFYPTKRRLDISIADAGLTIPGRVNRRFGLRVSPLKALRWALVEGHTTKENEPGGVGLKLLHQFVDQNGGCMQIASGGAFWQFCRDQEEFHTIEQVFPGTVVNLEINTGDNQLYGTGETWKELQS